MPGTDGVRSLSMDNMSVQGRRMSRGLLYSFAIGIIAVNLCYRIGAPLNLFETFSGWGVGAVTKKLERSRSSAQRGQSYGNESWQIRIAKRLEASSPLLRVDDHGRAN